MKVKQNSLCMLFMRVFFWSKNSYAIFFIFKNLKNSGLIPKLKDEREGREIERGCLVEVMKKKKKKIKSFLRLEDKTSREEIGQGLHNYIFLHRATSLQSSPLPLPQARFDLRYLCLPF